MTNHHEKAKPSQVNNHRWILGEWSYWPDSGLLKKRAKQSQLPTQLNDVLKLLVDRAPAVVTRDAFMDVVWSGKLVNEDALSRTIAELRKELGDSASLAKYIKTIPKKGYQLSIEPKPSQQQARQFLNYGGWFMLVMALLILVWIGFNQQPATDALIKAIANAQKITSKPGMEQQSRLSEDGQWLTYATNGIEQSNLTVQSLVDTNLVYQVELSGHRLASPIYDSAQNVLWFLARNHQGCLLISKKLQTNEVKQWSDCVFELESTTLAADFKQNMLYLSRKDGDNRSAIHQFNTTSGESAQLTHPKTDDQQDWSPNLSPDGQWLSFSRGNQTVRNIWLKNLASGEEKAVTFGEHYSVSHDWFDDKHVVFDSDMKGSRQLWILDITDQSIQTIGGYGAQHPSYAQNTDTMTFQMVAYEANIWHHNLANGEFNRLVHSTKYDNNPAFAPDDQSFAFTSNRQDVGSIWIYQFDSASDKLLLEISDAKLTRPVWGDAGKSLLVTVNDDSGYWTLSYDMQKQNYHKIPFSMNNLAAVMHGDKYYALAYSNKVKNQVLQLKDNIETILPIKHISRFMFLADGAMVYTKTNQSGIFMTSLNKLNEQLIVNNFSIKDMNLWTVVNQSVYYDQAGEDAGIYRLHVPTMSQQKVSDHRPYSVGTTLSVNHAEDAILITRTDRAESDVFKATIE